MGEKNSSHKTKDNVSGEKDKNNVSFHTESIAMSGRYFAPSGTLSSSRCFDEEEGKKKARGSGGEGIEERVENESYHFLDASSHLYKRVCPLVLMSVCLSICHKKFSKRDL